MKERTAPRRSRALPPLQSERLLDQLRERIRYLHYSIRTEQAYVRWVRAFVRFHGVRHPAEMGAVEVETFLTWLAAERRVAAATHRQALSAIVFLYTKVLGVELPWRSAIGRPTDVVPGDRPPRAREPDLLLRYTFDLPCSRATPSSTARATSAS